MFEQSTTTFIVAVQQIADSAGASADTEMTGRALVSLNAACKHFTTRYKWNWLRTEATPTAIVAPFNVSVTASGGLASAACGAGHGILVDDFVTGYGFYDGVRVSATAASGFGFTLVTTGFSGTAAFDVGVTRDSYALPTGFRSVYSVRFMADDKPIYPMPRRLYDRFSSTETSASDTCWYDIFNVGALGKIRFLPPPDSADVCQLRYYRAIATASASASTSALDIPADYDQYLIAWAKWHFLTDKGEGREKQATTWFALAEEGLKTMLKDQTALTDEDVGFVPGHSIPGITNSDTSTRNVLWDQS